MCGGTVKTIRKKFGYPKHYIRILNKKQSRNNFKIKNLKMSKYSMLSYFEPKGTYGVYEKYSNENNLKHSMSFAE